MFLWLGLGSTPMDVITICNFLSYTYYLDLQ